MFCQCRAIVYFLSVFFFLSLRRPPRATRTAILFPYSTLCRPDAARAVSIGGHSWALNPASTFRLGIADKDEWLAGLRLEGPVAGFTVRANLSTLRFADQTSRTSNGWRAEIGRAHV